MHCQLVAGGILFASESPWDSRPSMTCRIDRFPTVQGLVLRISGRIATDDLEVLRTALEESRVVAIELAEVELVDRDAVKLLVLNEAIGIELRHCPAYIREWVTRERESS